MQIKRHGEPTSLAKIKKGSLEEMLEAAGVSGGVVVGLPPHSQAGLRRALQRVLGVYVDTRRLNSILRGTGITADSVRESGAVRWLQVGGTSYYSLQDAHRLLAAAAAPEEP